MPGKLVVAIALVGWILVSPCSRATSSVELEAVLGSRAVLMIDGQRQTLKVGESLGGVTLVAADPAGVTLEIDGRSQTVGLSQRVGTAYTAPAEKVVTIARDGMLQYQTTATINGRSVLVLVDTGANLVAISAAQAKAMSIDYSAGIPSWVETAGGVRDSYRITLQSIDVGGIRVENVPATVIEGEFPATILLGMSYLQHVKLQEHNGILSLSRSH